MTDVSTPDPVVSLLRRMPYGFYALGSRNGSDSNLMVFNWLTQVSFEPQLLAVGLQKTAYSHGLVSASRQFAINFFLAEDAELIKPFTKSRAKNPDKMKGATFSPAPITGAPIVEGAAGYLELEVQNIIDIGGDLDIVVAKPLGGAVLKPGDVKDSLSLPHLGWSYAG